MISWLNLIKTCISGITNFDLLGNFGRIRWLGNYFIIFAVNFLFGGAAAVCLFNKVTHRAQVEIWRRLSNFLGGLKLNVTQKLGLWGKSWGITFSQKLPNVVSSPVRIKSEWKIKNTLSIASDTFKCTTNIWHMEWLVKSLKKPECTMRKYAPD